MDTIGKIKELVTFIYDDIEDVDNVVNDVKELVDKWRSAIDKAHSKHQEIDEAQLFSQNDAIVITYGDQFGGGSRQPMENLARFLDDYLDGTVTGVHILPFFPYSSDDGFSIINYREVNPTLGEWDTVRGIAGRFRLMCDLVLNHCSVQHEWFKRFLRCERPWTSYFISVPPGTDVSRVARPRALPLLTAFSTVDGEKLVWTTFSEDQVDLNYGDPAMLMEMLDICLFYLAQGVQIIRLDAIAYLWKEIGTPCIHHPKTHAMVKLFRAVFENVAPHAAIITETNVPQEENISYLGGDEAHMVYQFSLPPLTLHAFTAEDARPLSRFVRSLKRPAGNGTFFNFLASHDGVGVTPARGYLTEKDIQNLIERVEDRGGLVSYKTTSEGDVPYELNVNYFDAVADPSLPDDQRVRIFLSSQATMLAMPGVPGIYVHSLIGSGNWHEGVKLTGHNRSINREKLSYSEVVRELNDETSIRRKVFSGYRDLLLARSRSPAFHPQAEWRVLDGGPTVLAILRGAIKQEAGDGVNTDVSAAKRVLCLHNVSHQAVEFTVPLSEIGLQEGRHFRDIVTGDHVFPAPAGVGSEESVSFQLEAYEVLWLSY